jgi:hypothetical protein
MLQIARKRDYMATQVTTQAFRRGMSWGRKGIFRGNLWVEQEVF